MFQTPDKAILHTDGSLHLVVTTKGIRVKSETNCEDNLIFRTARCIQDSASPNVCPKCSVDYFSVSHLFIFFGYMAKIIRLNSIPLLPW